MSDGKFDFNEFISESKETLLNPQAYFTTMRTSGGITEPLIKAVIYGVIAGFFSLLWSIIHVNAGMGILGGGTGIAAFFWSIFASIIGLFVGAIVVMVLSAICKGNTDFEACARVAASLMVVYPISAFFGFATGVNLYLGMIISLAINIYSLWLLYNGLVNALKAKPETARIIMYVFVGLLLLMLLVGFGAKRSANRFMEQFNNSDFNIENTK